MNEAIKLDKEKHPDCFYSQMNEQQCRTGSDDNYLCTIIKRAQRMCPGERPVDIYVHKEETNDDLGNMNGRMITGMPNMPDMNGMEGAIFNDIFNGIAGSLFGRHFGGHHHHNNKYHNHDDDHDTHGFPFPGRGFSFGMRPFPFDDFFAFPGSEGRDGYRHDRERDSSQNQQEFKAIERLPPHWRQNKSDGHDNDSNNSSDRVKAKSKVVDVPRGPIDRI